jgi:octaprenyl-diphosphate synthase
MPARKIRSADDVSQDADSLSELLAPIAGPMQQVADRLGQRLITPYGPINQQIETIGAGHGKMLRPAFVLLSGLACGAIRPQHIELAAMIEMIHTATLLHDDVIDGAAMRRNHPTANCLHGNTAAVLLGDFLLSRAFQAGVELNLPHAQKILTQTAQQICQGELLQNIRRADWTMSQDDYLEIIEAKTAGLFSVACRLGSQLSGADSQTIENVAEYGRCVGLAFQITDDILDITGDAEKVGKTLGTDAAQKKPTLPLIHYLNGCSPQQRIAFLETISKEPDAEQFVKMLSDSGSIDYARTEASRFARKAIESIEACSPCPAADSLKKIATAVGKRA